MKKPSETRIVVNRVRLMAALTEAKLRAADKFAKQQELQATLRRRAQAELVREMKVMVKELSSKKGEGLLFDKEYRRLKNIDGYRSLVQFNFKTELPQELKDFDPSPWDRLIDPLRLSNQSELTISTNSVYAPYL